MPTRATKHSIAYDLYSPVDITIQPHTSEMFWTDIKAYFGTDEALLINVRSSMGKIPIMIANTQGWIESDYADNPSNEGNIGMRLYNLGEEPYHIAAGDRIAQGMFIKYLTTDDDHASAERVGGIGSSGK